jgi:magnesium-transporting ATPase (P-type)
VFYDYGFTVSTLIGSGLNYRDDYSSLPHNRKDFFDKMCRENSDYMDSHDKCGQDFVDYRLEALADAQTAFLMTVVWAQIANVLIRKTQVASIWEWDRITKNTFMLWSILAEIVIIVILCYVPGLNTVFLLAAPRPEYAACAIWIIPLLLCWDETRKWLCRKYPDSKFRKYSNF